MRAPWFHVHVSIYVWFIHLIFDRIPTRTGDMIDDLNYWHASDGQLTVSDERYKQGTSSLKWEWTSSSSLTYTNPDVFGVLKWASNKCFALWLYNSQPLKSEQTDRPQPMYVEFLTEKDAKPVAHLWFHVNFHGWRPLGLRYALLPQFKANLSRIHAIRFYPPANVGHGVYFLNGITFDYTHTVGPQADYQQPWATAEKIKRLENDPSIWLFDPNNIFHNRPWLEEKQVKATDEDVAKLKDRWLKNLPYGTW